MDKKSLLRVFDDQVCEYDKYRPGYPKELIDDLVGLSQIRPGGNICEVGCGTGQITVDLLRRGYHVTAIEKGESLAAFASKKMKDFDKLKIVNSPFEDWTTTDRFRLLISAQAFHWIQMESGVNKALALLEKGGSLALVWNVDQSNKTAFWRDTLDLYNRYMPVKPEQKNMEETIDNHWNYISHRKEFRLFERREYYWDKLYTSPEYLGLLSTFSSHMSLKPNVRRMFFQEINLILERHENKVLGITKLFYYLRAYKIRSK